MNAPSSPPAAPASRSGLALLLLILGGFVAYVSWKSGQLPAVVATHFDIHGTANGWMTRGKHLFFTIVAGTLTPLFIVTIFAFIRKRNGWGLNIPNKDYWLAPERRVATFDYLSQQGLWLSTLIVVFQAAMFKSILDANALRPPVLSTRDTSLLGGGFLVLIFIWITGLLLRFRRPKE